MKKIAICLLLVIALCAVMPLPALADNGKTPDEILSEVAKTAMAVALIVVVVFSIMFVIRQQFALVAAFIIIAVIVLTIIGTEGRVLVNVSDWVAGWFGADVDV